MMIMYSQHAQVFHLVRTQSRLWQAGAESISDLGDQHFPCICILSSNQDLAVLYTIICISPCYV